MISSTDSEIAITKPTVTLAVGFVQRELYAWLTSTFLKRELLQAFVRGEESDQ